ncbi:Peroxisomal biogenesis factor 2 [Erysiphe neolycopersici]|uniref:RING-type E3 ubiquitin transferase (cysteine targeting) n=1 Tax=Erysiphe neolycopersici TaxID=212602 RepID=A0A420HFL2_9PEZI|nr:Peroxisomal biogenesis factor 2 [Erysiphe neolycopersici]
MTKYELASAQQRLAARRAAATSPKAPSTSIEPSSSLLGQNSRLLAILGQFQAITWKGYENVSRREGTRPSYRVGQFDAEQLDQELLEILQRQVVDGLKYFGTHIHNEWAAEITFVLRAILFKLSVWDNNATYGAALQNLQFTDGRHRGEGIVAPSRWQKFSYGIISTGGTYAWTKWEEWVINRNTGRDSTKIIKIISRLYRVLDMVHFLAAITSFSVFLLNGRYRTLLDRILRLRLIPQNSQVSRQVSFEYLNRQLVWHAFTEFLLFLLPLVGVNKWRKWFTRVWKKTKTVITSGIEEDKGSKSGELAFLPDHTCAICYEEQNLSTGPGIEIPMSGSSGVSNSTQKGITNPYESLPCGCIYCYFCIASRLELEEGDVWTCLRCGNEVKECRPWNADILTEPVRLSTSSKTVLFT